MINLKLSNKKREIDDVSNIEAFSVFEPMWSAGDCDWQASAKSALERNAHMYLSPVMSDVVFVFPGNDSARLPAHRYVLATASSVFQAMFYGPMAEKAEIVITDVDVCAFREMLRYIYCDRVHLDPSLVMCILYCARKYHLAHLTTRCVQFLLARLDAGNIVAVLAHASMFDDNILTQACLAFIDLQAEEILSQDELMDIDRATLKLIVARDTLAVEREVIVLMFVDRWARRRCKQADLDETIDNKRSLLGDDILHLVRFPCMTLGELANQVVPLNLLTTQGNYR